MKFLNRKWFIILFYIPLIVSGREEGTRGRDGYNGSNGSDGRSGENVVVKLSG